jgi:metal-responsive CopG/Arc/MetJ family transcriptional regulator
MSDDMKDRRIHVPMSDAEVERLDSWRAGLRIWSRSEAIRRLIAEGLDRADAKTKKAPSSAATPTKKAAPRAKGR